MNPRERLKEVQRLAVTAGASHEVIDRHVKIIEAEWDGVMMSLLQVRRRIVELESALAAQNPLLETLNKGLAAGRDRGRVEMVSEVIKIVKAHPITSPTDDLLALCERETQQQMRGYELDDPFNDPLGRGVQRDPGGT